MFTLGIAAILICAIVLVALAATLIEEGDRSGYVIFVALIGFAFGIVIVCTTAPDAKSSKGRAVEYLKDYKRKVDDAEEDVRVNKIIQEIKNLNLKEKN